MAGIMERRKISLRLWNKIQKEEKGSEKIILVCNWPAIPEILKTSLHVVFLCLASTCPLTNLISGLVSLGQ